MYLIKKILVFILTIESRLILAKYKPFIIAITGSVGKTSTKDAIYSVLRDNGSHVRKSEKSMNSEIGLPLTIVGVPNAWRDISGWMHNITVGFNLILKKSEYPDTLVLEVGADHQGDIRRVAKWLCPDIAVITQVSSTPAHVEFFPSPEAVFEEKSSLAECMKKDGTLILFANNEKVMSIADRVKDKNAKVITFGTVDSSSIKGSNISVCYESVSSDAGSATKVPTGFDFDISFDGGVHKIILKNIIGETYMYPLLAATAVAKARNIPVENIVKKLHEYDAPKSRMNLIQGINDTTIIDDTYNSSPDAVMSALQTMKHIECSGSKIAMFGDMMELGKYATEEHRGIGKKVFGIVDQLITVGQRSRLTADEALKSGMKDDQVHAFDTSADAGEFVKSIIKSGDLILVKGSQSIRTEKIVKVLMRYPEQASARLVRQEEEWLRR